MLDYFALKFRVARDNLILYFSRCYLFDIVFDAIEFVHAGWTYRFYLNFKAVVILQIDRALPVDQPFPADIQVAIKAASLL